MIDTVRRPPRSLVVCDAFLFFMNPLIASKRDITRDVRRYPSEAAAASKAVPLNGCPQ
jgi:hypothetical protein